MRLRPLVAVIGALSLVSCDRDEVDPDYKAPMINGFLYKVENYDSTVDYNKDFEVFDGDGLRMVPIVTLNGNPVKPYYYNFTAYRYGDADVINVDTTYQLEVTHYWGKAGANVFMPGDFRVTAPSDSYILGRESTLVVVWNSSPGAEWYWADLYCDYEFLDTIGEWDDYSFNLDTVVFDTFIAVPPSRVFPGNVVQLIEGDGSALVWAGDGPAVEPGDTANVVGVGFGFFTAVNEPMERYFYVGAPPLERRSPGSKQSRDKFVGRLRQRWGGATR